MRLKKGDLVVFTRQTKSNGVIIPTGIPLLVVHYNSEHIVVRYDGRDFKLRKLDDRMKLVTSDIAKVLFHEND